MGIEDPFLCVLDCGVRWCLCQAGVLSSPLWWPGTVSWDRPFSLTSSITGTETELDNFAVTHSSPTQLSFLVIVCPLAQATDDVLQYKWHHACIWQDWQDNLCGPSHLPLSKLCLLLRNGATTKHTAYLKGRQHDLDDQHPSLRTVLSAHIYAQEHWLRADPRAGLLPPLSSPQFCAVSTTRMWRPLEAMAQLFSDSNHINYCFFAVPALLSSLAHSTKLLSSWLALDSISGYYYSDISWPFVSTYSISIISSDLKHVLSWNQEC